MVTLRAILDMQDIFDTLVVHLSSLDVHVLKCTSKTMKELLHAHTASNEAFATIVKSKWSMKIAMKQGLGFAEWARGVGCPWDTRTCEAAARGGQLEILQWARANGCPWDGY
eukprot:CAMPEP_0118926082 /NCGR_PEP_ID=MMETSP1169-20130426/3861_1 /TAXON_ID=36882 /ORGANISM="Pyramimonas obovata, Strain CCMP722" /LENGTH=111 /DNA_ID=CAMNT_0006867559 /DNA_START=552 /DNA_END=884 /DNA_ORIENTATION=-